MKSQFLLPWTFRPVGILLAPLFCYLIEADIQLPFLDRSPVDTHSSDGRILLSFRSENASIEVWMLGLVLSLMFIAFSRLRRGEDEYTTQLRMRAWVQSVYINFILAVVIIFFSFGLEFLFFASMQFLALLVVFSILFYGRLALRRFAIKASAA